DPMKKNSATGKYVKPFTTLEVKRIKAELTSKPNKRNYCLFVMAINQGIRSTDLLKIRIRDVENLPIGEKFFFKEGKTGKQNFVFMNKNTYDAVHLYMESLSSYGPDDYLFCSRSGNNAITLQQFGRLIKDWCSYARIKEPAEYGIRSLRKTFGRLEFESSGNSNVVTLLKERFNHSSESTTIKYLNITTADMEMIFSDK
ncbi:MAG: tyrosine-type recombinase/integrase, partial [Desulfamplus sp.]|nr:tyrosine-type recombinase/integrase [Desulfamplus sp.]